MKLSQLLSAVEHRLHGAGDPEVAAIVHDSRRVRPGALFAAFRGLQHDGRAFADQAVACGAAAVLAEGAPPTSASVPYVLVDDARRAAGLLAARLAGDPAERLVMIGVTGTSGKTTTATLIERVAADHLGPTGLFGTLGYRGAGVSAPGACRTTPEATELQPMLGALLRAGGVAAVMECSSHAIDLRRLAGCRYDVAVFTNLSRDHLDYHAGFDDYFEAKARLFELLKPEGIAIVNADDDWGRKLLGRLPRGHAHGFTLRGSPGASILGHASVGPLGTTISVTTDRGPSLEIASPLLGAPNAENLLAAAAAGLLMGIPPARVAASLGAVACVPGRMERVDDGSGVVAVVDYAHKPAALEGVLRTCRGLTAPGGRVVAVFGCGGDRDRGKRPEMGRIAATLADVVVITSDNPRSEDPRAIAAEIESGVLAAGGAATIVIDRATAIAEAAAGCRAGDVLLIAGKGHEQSQEVAGRKEPFDDRAVARAVLASARGRRASPAAGQP